VKNLIAIAVVVVVGLVAYNYFQTGEFSIMPGGSQSDEAQQVNRLRGEFRQAAQEYRQAGRAAGLGGLDTTSDAEAALNTVEGVKRDLEKLRGQVQEAEVRREIDQLLTEINNYLNEIR
jgi:hypothetical protein